MQAKDLVRKADTSWVTQKWVPRENLHLTLRFLGDVPEETIPDLSAQLDAACKTCSPFTLHIRSLRAIPESRHARMLWIDFVGDLDAIKHLHSVVASACAPFTTALLDRQPYHPHVTLARSHSPRPILRQALDDVHALVNGEAIPGRSIPTREIRFFSSVLTPHGPIYKTLHRIAIGSD